MTGGEDKELAELEKKKREIEREIEQRQEKVRKEESRRAIDAAKEAQDRIRKALAALPEFPESAIDAPPSRDEERFSLSATRGSYQLIFSVMATPGSVSIHARRPDGVMTTFGEGRTVTLAEATVEFVQQQAKEFLKYAS
jgi:hypothetical protein